jgi:hypothetical protein
LDKVETTMDYKTFAESLISHIDLDRHLIGDVLRFAQTNPACNQVKLEEISNLMISNYGKIKSEIDEARKTLPDIPELRDLPDYDHEYIYGAPSTRRGGRRSTRSNRRSTRRNRSRKH